MHGRVSLPSMLLFLLLLTLLVWLRMHSENFDKESVSLNHWSKAWSPILDKSMSGAIPGLVADFHVLHVFSVYYAATQQGHQKEQMQYIAPYLQRAQNLDPNFFDVYRLAGSLLAYDAAMPEASIKLLQKGAAAIPSAWEFPLIAGFIAHDVLKDDQLAFSLLSEVAAKEGAPLLVATLAARFLASATTVEDAILFLKSMLQLVPESYGEGIRRRITQLEAS